MVDTISPEHRSWNMSQIKGKDTKPELIVRSHLHKMGFRFRLHRKDLPGKPDIVLPKHRTVIFVHGCFWHRHKSCKYSYNPKSRKKFWREKFEGNVERDKRNRKELFSLDWRSVVVWECQTNHSGKLQKLIGKIFN
jgi:DNA mismatch endonuclease, patch repair protein